MSVIHYAAKCRDFPEVPDSMVSARAIARYYKLFTEGYTPTRVEAANMLRDRFGLHPNLVHACLGGCGNTFYYYDRDRVNEYHDDLESVSS